MKHVKMKQPSTVILVLGSAVTRPIIQALEFEKAMDRVHVVMVDPDEDPRAILEMERDLVMQCTEAITQFDPPPEEPPPVNSTDFLRNFGRKKGHWEK